MTLPVRKNIDVLTELVPLKGRTVVDVGCGDGGLVRRLSREGAQVTGVECGEAALEAARKAQAVGLERYLFGTGQALPLPDASADVIVYANALHHVPVPDMAQALAEAARVLKPGGYLYVQEPLAEGAYFDLMRPVDDETEIRAAAQSILATAPKAGLKPVTTVRYQIIQTFDGFEGFALAMAQVDPDRLPIVRSMQADLEHRFRSLGTPSQEKMTFDQPMKVDLFQSA